MTIRTLIGKCLPLFLVIAILVFAFAPRKSRAQSSSANTFAFWYEDWIPDTTIGKLQAANVIIGVPPSAVSEIHKSGRHALQYVTYYQSVFDHPFLKDEADLPKVGFHAKEEFEKSAFGGENNYVLCPNSVELKARALRYVEETVKQGYDGYFVDNTFLGQAAHEICNAPHGHVRDNINGWNAYVYLVAAVKNKLKQENPTALVIINPGKPSSIDRMPSGKTSLWDVSDYILWESYGYSSHRGSGHDRWKNTIDESFTFAAEPGRVKKIIALSYPEDLAEARFSFAVAKIFGFQWTANLGDRDQHNKEEGGHFGAFLNEVPFALGEPIGGLPEKATPLLHRDFQNGEAFANTGTTAQAISVPKGSAIYLGGQPVQTAAPGKLALGPMTAAIVVRRH
jgi:hypothetical protein